MSRLIKLFQTYPPLTLHRNERLVRSGEEPRFMYLVKSGAIRHYSTSARGDELTVQVYASGDFFFLPWINGLHENSYQFEALMLTQVWQAPIGTVMPAMRSDPDLMYEMVMQAADGINGLISHLESLVFGKATEKIAAALVMLAHEYGDTEGSGVKIQFPLPHRILASFVGMTRETVSLGMQELTKRNYIHSRGQRVTVLDLDSLREWIENGS